MKTVQIWIGATLAMTALAGCVEDAANDTVSENTAGVTEQPRRHCNVAAAASVGGAAVEFARAGAAAPACFDSFSDAIFAATRGTLRLSADATPDTFAQLPKDQLAAAATFLLAIEYVAPQRDAFWGSMNVTTTLGTCDNGFTFSISDLRSVGFDDRISSAWTSPGCAHGFHFEHPNFGGARLDCTPAPGSCLTFGALDDRTTSIRWTNGAN